MWNERGVSQELEEQKQVLVTMALTGHLTDDKHLSPLCGCDAQARAQTLL